MDHAICSVPLAPLYKEPGFLGEMSSQLLFGEKVSVAGHSGKLWVKVVGLSDGYTGWVTKHQLSPARENAGAPVLVTEPLGQFEVEGANMYLPMGSDISSIDGRYSSLATDVKEIQDSILHYATRLLNAPYQWGGRSILGIDCSGFSQLVYRMCNRQLLRDAHQQATQGEVVNFLQESIPGDLAFFDNEEGNIIHVGILMSAESVIHAAGKVRIDAIDNHGIVHAGTGERTHRLRIIKRIA